MKKIISCLLFLFFSFQIYAQNAKDVVFLKNGSVIKGVILEQIIGVSLKIQTSDGNIFSYKMDDIEKFEKESANSVAVNLKPLNESPTNANEKTINNSKPVFVKVSVGNKFSLASGFSDMYNNGTSVKLGLYSSLLGITTGYTSFSGKGINSGNSFSYIPILLTFKMLDFKTNGLHLLIDSEFGGYSTKTTGTLLGISMNNSKFYYGLNLGVTLAYKINDRFIPNFSIDSDLINIFGESSYTLYGAHLGLIYKI